MTNTLQTQTEIALADLKAIKYFQSQHPGENKGYFIRYSGAYGQPQFPYGMWTKEALPSGANDFVSLIFEGMAGYQPYKTSEEVLENAVEYIPDIEAYKKEKVLFVADTLQAATETDQLDSFINIIAN